MILSFVLHPSSSPSWSSSSSLCVLAGLPQPRLDMYREDLDRPAGSLSNLQRPPPDLPQQQQADAQPPPQQHPSPPDLPQQQQACAQPPPQQHPPPPDLLRQQQARAQPLPQQQFPLPPSTTRVLQAIDAAPSKQDAYFILSSYLYGCLRLAWDETDIKPCLKLQRLLATAQQPTARSSSSSTQLRHTL